MNKVLADLVTDFNFKGEILEDSVELLIFHGNRDVAEHSSKVASGARSIANKFGIDEHKVFVAACLHDISRVFPNDKMLEISEKLGIEVIQEERKLPSLLHSKISKVIANEVFGIEDADVLNAIECHSTLKANPGLLDMVLFLADKTSWDSIYNKDFINNVNEGLEKSLEYGALEYLKYVIKSKENMKVLHPWTVEAYNELSNKLE